MVFSDFARKLKEIIGGDNNGGEFVKELFLNITLYNDSEDNPIEKRAPSSFRAYYAENRKITRIATEIRKNIEPEMFATYINSQEAEALQDIYKVFSPFVPGMDESNIPEKMAELFKDIIVQATTKKKKSTRNSLKTISDSTKTVVKDEEVAASDFPLLDECKMRCPLCGAKLVETKKGAHLKKYSVVSVFPIGLTDAEKIEFSDLEKPPTNLYGLENKTLLCKKCADNYLIDTTPDEYAELMKKKKSLAFIAQLDTEAFDINVERGIDHILNELTSLKVIPKKESKTRWKALRVNEKIVDNLMLQDIVTEYVLKYYRYIEAQFKQRVREGKLRFNKVRNEISQCFEIYDEADLSQEDIYSKLVDWLKEKTSCNNEIACNAMISFFVQNCEVFKDETAEQGDYI